MWLLDDFFFFFKQKTVYEVRIRDLSSDVCSSDLDRVAGSEDLKSLIAGLAASVSRRRGLSLLWQREARYLPDEQREEMRATLKSAAARDAALIRTERPELDEEDSYLLAWALIAVFNSVSSHRVSLPSRQMELQIGRASCRDKVCSYV